MTIVGTRPEIIRLSLCIKKFDQYFDHILVHTGQNYDFELNEIFFRDLEVRKPNYFLDSKAESTMATIGVILTKIDQLMREVKPEAILILGDTNSCLVAIAAKRLKIPIFHMEAGNRCYDQRVPEETNRKIVDHISDINMTYSTIAREQLIREGLASDRVIKTGSPMFEVLNYFLPKIRASQILEQLRLSPKKYFLVSAHREENIESDQQFSKLVESLNTIAEKFNLPVIVSTHPRTRKRIDAIGAKFHQNVQLLKPMGFLDYNFLQMNSMAVLSDSGTITEESSILNFPALNIREAHERPEGFEEGSVMMVGLDVNRVMSSLEILKAQQGEASRQFRLVQDYSMPNVSDKVVRIIQSYTDFVNRFVWRKDIEN